MNYLFLTNNTRDSSSVEDFFDEFNVVCGRYQVVVWMNARRSLRTSGEMFCMYVLFIEYPCFVFFGVLGQM